VHKGAIACTHYEERAEEKTREEEDEGGEGADDEVGGLPNGGKWMPLLGGAAWPQVSVADFNEMALDHGDALGSHEGYCRQLTVPQRLRNQM
jgi:hypothetical protein